MNSSDYFNESMVSPLQAVEKVGFSSEVERIYSRVYMWLKIENTHDVSDLQQR